jgi:hypothetical protein
MMLTQLARFAATTDNVVHRRELHRLGYDDNAIHRMCRSGVLHRIARGIYSVGSTYLSFRGRCRVALHLAGPGSGITGFAAMYLYGLITYEPNIIEVLSTRRAPRRGVPGIRHRYTRNLGSDEVSVVDGLRVASFGRALVSVAGHRTADQLTKLMREARYQGMLHMDLVRASVERCKHAGHSDKLRSAMAQLDRGSNGSFSNGESTMWALLHDVVPDETPLQNPDVYLEGHPTLPDLVWLGSMVIAEYDGAPHQHADAQVDDRVRERRYRRKGFVIIRVTPEDLAEHPEAIRADVLEAIERQRSAIAAGIITPRSLAEYADRDRV